MKLSNKTENMNLLPGLYANIWKPWLSHVGQANYVSVKETVDRI